MNTSAQRGYGYRWQQARLGWLRHLPLCAECERHGRIAQASVVDHIHPHHGDPHLFWNRTNWQSLCKHCHDAHKQSGVVLGCTTDGQPIDPNPPWNQGRVG